MQIPTIPHRSRIQGKTSIKWLSWLQLHKISCRLCFTLLMVVVTVPACDNKEKKEITKHITGEVFITTKSGDVVLLGGVQIRFYENSKVQESIEQAMANAATDMPPFEKGIAQWAEALDHIEKNPEFHKRFPDTYEKVETYKNYIRQYEYARANWPDANYIFPYFPDPTLETRADSQGRYTITLPAGDWVAVVNTKRLIGKIEESYYWAVSISANGSTTLSNYNLVDSDSPDSVLHVPIRGPKTGSEGGEQWFLDNKWWPARN